MTAPALLVQDLKRLLDAAPNGGLPLELCHILEEARSVVCELEAIFEAAPPVQPLPQHEPARPQAASARRPVPPQGITTDTLDQLLALVPAEQAPLLIESFLTDLGAVRQGLNQLPQQPPAQANEDLGTYLHNLISLAGTAGAHQLHDRACALHAARSAEDHSLAHALLPGLSDDLDHLLDYLTTRAQQLAQPEAVA